MKNKRITLKENQTVNEVQLKDLYSAASKVEQQIISLADLSIAFSNPEVKKRALTLKSQVTEFTNLLGNILTGVNDEEEQLPLENPGNEKEDIEARPAPNVQRESVNKNVLSILKKLHEALDLEEDEVELEHEGENEETLETQEENEVSTEINLSEVIASLLSEVSEEKIIEAKNKIVEVLNNSPAKEISKSFESVVDSESFDYALEELYNFCDENEITIITF